MKAITKILGATAAVAALGLAGAYAFAESGHGPGHGRMDMGHGMGHGMMNGGGHGGRMGHFGDPAERLANAKAAIGIKAEQAAAWDAYAKVVTETAAERRKHHESIDRDAVHNMKPEDRRAFRESMMQQRDEAQAKVKAAAEMLLAQLDDAQKAKARENLPGFASGHGPGPRHGMHHGMRHGMMGGHGGGHGMRSQER